MIIENLKNDVLVFGDTNTRKATISQDKMAKLQHLLTKGLYKDPITAVIAEWTNNAIDSVVQAGKDPVKHPVVVQIMNIDNGQSIFSVEDKGTGLDDVTFKDICMNYLESTKEQDNDTIGHFGIGMKSFLSLERGATFTCRKDGIERKYFCYEGTEFLNYDLLHEIPTKEPNGVRAELIVKNYQEKNQFIEKMKTKLAYYDTVVMMDNSNIINNQIHRHDLFQWSNLRHNGEMHLTLKDVYYSIDWEALGIRPINLNVALRFSLKDGIVPTPSRESYITNDNSRELILKRIGEVAEYFVKKYNETVQEDTFLNAIPFVDVTRHYVNIPPRNMQIDSIIPYSKIPIKIPILPYMKHKNLNYYRLNMGEILGEYEVIVDASYRWKSSRFYSDLKSHMLNGAKIIICDGVPLGNEREYLKDKHNRFVIVRHKGKTSLFQDDEMNPSYYYLLTLSYTPKHMWRERIVEWQTVRDELTSNFIDERRLHRKPEFQKWLADKKEEQKKQRLLNKAKGITTGLMKQDGDVTIAYARKAKLGFSVCFEKAAHPAVHLAKNKYLTVYSSEEDKPMLESLFWKCHKVHKVHIKFAIIGKKEQTKLPKNHQFIKLEEFMKTKPFQRIASAILFSRLIADFDKINSNKTGIFENCLKQVVADRNQLGTYAKYNKESENDAVEDAILTVAEEHDLFDRQLWDVYSRLRKAVETYEFITCLAVPESNWNDTERSKYSRLINQILLFRKKYYDDLPKNAVITFEETPEVSEEQLALEFQEEASVNI